MAYVPKATVQAAIGAVPLAAGVPSGELILAVAVLSILLTAPLGAIGIIVSGERILDHGERSLYRFKELREALGLPHVGERVRKRDDDSVWKVIEEREIWIESQDPTGGSRLVPAISLRYWEKDLSASPGTGKTLTCRYWQNGSSFQDEWEILYDW